MKQCEPVIKLQKHTKEINKNRKWSWSASQHNHKWHDGRCSQKDSASTQQQKDTDTTTSKIAIKKVTSLLKFGSWRHLNPGVQKTVQDWKTTLKSQWSIVTFNYFFVCWKKKGGGGGVKLFLLPWLVCHSHFYIWWVFLPFSLSCAHPTCVFPIEIDLSSPLISPLLTFSCLCYCLQFHCCLHNLCFKNYLIILE